MGFIGKLVEFMATKLIGKRLDLALDKKKKACKTFLAFLDSLSQLERLFGDFVKYIESFVAGKNSHIYRVHLERVTGELAKASRDFLENIEALGQVIYLYDSNLARLFSRMMHVKFGLTLVASQFFQSVTDEYDLRSDVADLDDRQPVMRFDRLAVDNPYYRGLDFTLPSEELMRLNLNEAYDKIVSESDDLTPDGFLIFGTRASTDILLNLVRHKYIEKRIGPDDIDVLIDLYPTLKSHQEVLRKARESLREFIRKNFSLEDLLYVL